jgi:hypothetical protein
MHADCRRGPALPVPICRAGFIAMLINFNKLMAASDIRTIGCAQNRTNSLAEIEPAHKLPLRIAWMQINQRKT